MPKDPGAQRELLFADDVSGVPNVVPVVDRGDADDCWAIIMPRADKSLRQHLGDAGGSLSAAETVAILLDVATALEELEARGVIHRDLKPENVLLLDGRWCLVDFGISKYAAAVTGPETRKHYWTAPYAAPEQWRYETARPATDIYALGVIAYELLAGVTPFVATTGTSTEIFICTAPFPASSVPPMCSRRWSNSA